MKLQPRNRPHRRSRPAFTLMEVLVVVAILVVLAGIGVVVFRQLSTSQEKIAKVKIKNVEMAVNSYKLDYSQFPDTLESLTVPSEGKAAYLSPEALLDPWGRPYKYDASQLSTTGIPLIYSDGEHPGQSTPIRNW